jgi:hypothetical protein
MCSHKLQLTRQNMYGACRPYVGSKTENMTHVGLSLIVTTNQLCIFVHHNFSRVSSICTAYVLLLIGLLCRIVRVVNPFAQYFFIAEITDQLQFCAA